MCGIVGYVGCKQATPVLINALRKLEYRGYDSAGVAVLSESGDEILIRKSKGALKFLVEKITGQVIKESKNKDAAAAQAENEEALNAAVEKTADFVKGHIGIGHTRWATHGEPSELNSHPHTNESGSVAVVHNGIIENYATLKAWLQNQGVVFRSQTWVGEHSASNHHAGKLRVASFHFTDLRDACDVAVINERVATFCIKFFERLEVDSAFVLLFAESWVKCDLRERCFV